MSRGNDITPTQILDATSAEVRGVIEAILSIEQDYQHYQNIENLKSLEQEIGKKIVKVVEQRASQHEA